MTIILNLLMIHFINVYVIEISGFVESISKSIWEKFAKIKYNGWIIPKPFSCSLCMTMWSTLLYCSTIPSITLIECLFLSCVNSCLTLITIPMLNKIINIINDKLV